MAKIKYVVFHRQDKNNVGDMSANPLQYFLKPDEYQVVDIDSVGTSIYPNDVPKIVGGGGLISNENFENAMRVLANDSELNHAIHNWEETINSLNLNHPHANTFITEVHQAIHKFTKASEQPQAPAFLWGAGTNLDTNGKMPKGYGFPAWLNNFTKVGLRDDVKAYSYVPCASCMHPAFDKNYPIKNKVIWFEHKKQLLKSTSFGKTPVPRFINSGNNMEQTIELLGSAEYIITNSYHGAYWGTLLGRKVIVSEPWSTKFYFMRYKPYMLQKGEQWEDVLDLVPKFDNTALEDSRFRTREFWKEIQQS